MKAKSSKFEWCKTYEEVKSLGELEVGTVIVIDAIRYVILESKENTVKVRRYSEDDDSVVLRSRYFLDFTVYKEGVYFAAEDVVRGDIIRINSEIDGPWEAWLILEIVSKNKKSAYVYGVSNRNNYRIIGLSGLIFEVEEKEFLSQ